MKKLTFLFILINALIFANAQSSGQITGKVIDKETGVGLADVSVIERNTNNGTRTDASGNFSLKVSVTGKVELEISLVSYGTLLITADPTTPVTITMDKQGKSLDEVVVIGYGTARKRLLTGSVVSIKGDEVRKIPAGNIIESVQGKVAGVDIVRTSGGAGANVSVTVRGNRSIIAGNSPLYIVDGIQYSSFQDINPNDIESMEFLKDASSTAIYGSRGANGVILITTKKGNSGKVKISVGSYYGTTDVAGYPKPMTGPEYANLKRQGARTIGIWNSPADDSKVFTSQAERDAVNNGVSTYWPGLLLGKGSQQDYAINVSAGSDKTKVYFSFDYYKEKGLLSNDYSGRYTFRLNVDQTIANSLKVGLQSQLTEYDQNLRSDGILTVANKVIPYYTPYEANGSLDTLIGNQNNPLLEEEPGAYINSFKITRILSTAYIDWRPFKGFSVRSNLGISTSNTRNGGFQGANTISRALSTGSLSSVSNSNGLGINWENIINWQKKFDAHSLELTAVTSYISGESENFSASGTGQLIANQSFYALQNNPANLAISSGYSSNKLISGAFRANYNYKGKYLLTLTGRADGASVLSSGNQWAFFPSAAAAWRISDESFMQNQNVFNELKLRISYGVAGNSAVGPYQTQSGLMLIPFSWNDQSALSYALAPQTGNPDLQWELTNTGNIGVDFSILKNRITGSFDYYDSKTNDLLLLRQLPPTSGVSSILQNIGKTRNNGFEISLQTQNINSKNVKWNSTFTYTQNKERIVELVGQQNDVANSWFIGSPVNSFYDYEKVGIWQMADSVLAKSFGYKPGDIRVSDLSGPAGKPDGKLDANNDRKVLGSSVPDYSIGFGNNVTFKGFDLDVYVYARMGQMFVSNYANKFEPNAIENGAKVDYWTPENPTNDYPRPNSNISRAALPFATTLGYKDGSFVKIRSLTLGYSFPKSIQDKLHASRLRIYVSLKNYFTFAKVDDYDPEGAGSFERPLTKLIVAGINLDF